MGKLEQLKRGSHIHAITVEEVVRLVAIMKRKKRTGIVDEIAGKYKKVGQKLAKQKKTSVDLIREARDETYAS